MAFLKSQVYYRVVPARRPFTRLFIGMEYTLDHESDAIDTN